VFAERRQRLRDAMGPDAIAILLGAKLASRSADTDYRFRQEVVGFECARKQVSAVTTARGERWALPGSERWCWPRWSSAPSSAGTS